MSHDHDGLAGLNELPLAVRNEIGQLESDGYYVYRLWANGVELRKGPNIGPIRIIFSILMLLCMPLMPFVARSMVRNLSGYRHRIFVTLDESEPLIRFV